MCRETNRKRIFLKEVSNGCAKVLTDKKMSKDYLKIIIISYIWGILLWD